MDRVRIDVRMPRGPDHYWSVMCDLSKRGGFTIGDVYGCTNGVARRTVKEYVLHCAELGVVKVTSSAPTPRGGADTKLYTVAQPSREAPVIRRPGYTGERGRIQAQLWTAMRGLPHFNLVELAAAASTDDLEIKVRTAEGYVVMLVQAGYLAVVQPSVPGTTAGVWRLKPSMNTGPKAPARYKAVFVVDRNRERVVGAAPTAELAA